MQELFLRGFRLLAANDELAAFDRDVEFFQAKACDSERNAQFLFFGLLDVVRRIAIGCSFGGALEKTLKVLKTEQERTVEIDGTVHIQSPPSSDFGSVGPRKRATRFGNPGKGRYLLLTMWGAAGPNQGLGKCCQNWRLPGENTLCSVRLRNSRARTLRPWSASEFLGIARNVGSARRQRAQLCERVGQQPTADFGDASFANVRVEDFGEIALLEALAKLAGGGPRAECRQLGARYGSQSRRLLAIDKLAQQVVVRRRCIAIAKPARQCQAERGGAERGGDAASCHHRSTRRTRLLHRTTCFR